MPSDVLRTGSWGNKQKQNHFLYVSAIFFICNFVFSKRNKWPVIWAALFPSYNGQEMNASNYYSAYYEDEEKMFPAECYL